MLPVCNLILSVTAELHMLTIGGHHNIRTAKVGI